MLERKDNHTLEENVKNAAVLVQHTKIGAQKPAYVLNVVETHLIRKDVRNIKNMLLVMNAVEFAENIKKVVQNIIRQILVKNVELNLDTRKNVVGIKRVKDVLSVEVFGPTRKAVQNQGNAKSVVEYILTIILVLSINEHRV